MNNTHHAPCVLGTRVPDAGVTPPMAPTGWFDAQALAELARVSISQARRYLSAWEREACEGRPAPRTTRWRRPLRGQPPLLAWAEDVYAHLAIDEAA